MALLVITMLLYFGCVMIKQAHVYAGIGWMLIVVVLLVVPGLMMMDQTSDLLVEQVGLSKIFKGMVWQKITWTNVKVIRVFKLRAADNKIRTAMHLFPLKRPEVFFLKKKMVFSLNDTNSRRLMEILTRYEN